LIQAHKKLQRDLPFFNKNPVKEFVSKYQIFNLSPEGPEERDFKEWASNTLVDHHLAKKYRFLQMKE